ncbi:hypothetical protein GAYE_PCTG14G0588 [Galdieria yellowstonensis]|uniref:Transmembrane protein n=1 Tax=Galdieria yellowstonensis TaxID=3028027 RepID=A0AAV9I6M9_9RHOD|nr:hypothetical protein GAYE_PCTG14G0588 [Galdieria yellowstonensis]
MLSLWKQRSILVSLVGFIVWFLSIFDPVYGLEELVLQVEHSLDMGNTWFPRGQVHLSLEQQVNTIQVPFTETDSLKHLIDERQRYFIRISNVLSSTSSSSQNPWLVTSYRACRLVELNFREVVLIYLDAEHKVIGLGAGYSLHNGVCNHTGDVSIQELVGYWYIKTPHFPKILGPQKKETVQEEEESFKKGWWLWIFLLGLLLNVLLGWIRMQHKLHPTGSGSNVASSSKEKRNCLALHCGKIGSLDEEQSTKSCLAVMSKSDSEMNGLYYVCHNCRRRLPKVNWQYVKQEGLVFCSGDCSLSFELGVKQRKSFCKTTEKRRKWKGLVETQVVEETPKPTWAVSDHCKAKDPKEFTSRSWENALFQLDWIQDTADWY